MNQQQRNHETVGLKKATTAVGLAFFFAGAAGRTCCGIDMRT